MFNQNLQQFLIEETAKLSRPVLDFVDNSIVTYDTGVDPVLDEQIRDAYMLVVEAIDSWMRMVVAFDAVENGSDVYSISLELPDGMHMYQCISGVDFTSSRLPVVHTPIGDLDYFCYRAIVDIKDNPVLLFYKAMQKQINRVHNLITLDPDGYNDDLITSAILDLCGICDPLNVCRLDSCLTHIDEFFEAHGFHEGQGGRV